MTWIMPDAETETPGDSYVTHAEAAAYFANDARATAFLALAVNIQETHLLRATRAIDALPLQGTKYLLDGTQELQFPRQYREGYDMDESTGEAEVPQRVKDACCEEALALSLEQAGGGASRAALQEAGVQSYQIPGIISETFRPGAGSGRYGLRSADAHRLLSLYIARRLPIV